MRKLTHKRGQLLDLLDHLTQERIIKDTREVYKEVTHHRLSGNLEAIVEAAIVWPQETKGKIKELTEGLFEVEIVAAATISKIIHCLERGLRQ